MGEWIPVMVRSEDYLEIAKLVAEREAGRPDGSFRATAAPTLASTAPTVTTAVRPTGAATSGTDEAVEHLKTQRLAERQPWDEASLRQMATSKSITMQRWTRAMDFLAQHPGEFLSTEQVCAGTGMTIDEWRDAPRKITRHLAAHYDVPEWPVANIRGRELRLDDQIYWAITEEQARRWTAVRAA